MPVHPQCRNGRAFAHTTGAPGPGHPHRSDGGAPQTPRGARHTGRHGGPGTTPPVPGSPTRPFRALAPPVLSLSLLAVVTWQIAAHGPLRSADERLGRAVAGSPAVPTALAEFLADLGETVVALPVLGAAVLWTLWPAVRSRGPRRWLPPVAAALTMAAVPALVVPLKAWLARPGPPAMAGGAHAGFFPSGHAATAAVAYGAALLLLLPRMPRRAWAVAGYTLLNAGVAVGLVRRGYHWPLDVLGAWCLAAVPLWCLAVVLARTGVSCRSPGRPGPGP